MAPLGTLFLVPSQWGKVHQVGFIMFSPMVEKLLNIENSFKSKLKNYKRIWATDYDLFKGFLWKSGLNTPFFKFDKINKLKSPYFYHRFKQVAKNVDGCFIFTFFISFIAKCGYLLFPLYGLIVLIKVLSSCLGIWACNHVDSFNFFNFLVVLCCNLLGLDMFKCPKYDDSIS
jgi:hypothetical protein